MPYRLALAVVLLAAMPAHAAPSCRDSKGAFTPCTPHQIRETAHSAQERPTDRAKARTTDAVADPMLPAHTKKPALITRSRLCRDSKGLFTPCPH